MDFLTYHIESSRIKDIDPANDCLRYISDRFELSMEQRYWLAFLYSTCYCGPTVFYIYNEFPDFENVDVPRLQRWWDAHKSQTVFQTDRLRIKTGNKFVETFESYRDWVGSVTQEQRFEKLKGFTLTGSYENAFDSCGKIKNVGRFTLFIYLEMISVLTNFKCEPHQLEWRFADNCRKGLCYHLGMDDSNDYELLDCQLDHILESLRERACDHSNIFNVETTLCAYKKFIHGKRYIGYYIDRQLEEINKMKTLVTEGVAWRVLDQFRIETYMPEVLKEIKSNQPSFDGTNLFKP